jgi:hypothetical protein
MTTFLAPDRISSLQRDFGVAVAAQVVDGGALDGDPGLEGVASRCRYGGRDLICFARHVCGFSWFWGQCVDL